MSRRIQIKNAAEVRKENPGWKGLLDAVVEMVTELDLRTDADIKVASCSFSEKLGMLRIDWKLVRAPRTAEEVTAENYLRRSLFDVEEASLRICQHCGQRAERRLEELPVGDEGWVSYSWQTRCDEHRAAMLTSA